MNVFFGATLLIALVALIVSEIYRSGKIAYWPGQQRLKATPLQMMLVGVAAVSGFALLLRSV